MGLSTLCFGYNPIRVAYWFAATALSVCGIAEFVLATQRDTTIDSACRDSTWVTRYSWFRLVLGVSQPLIHLGLLLPARVHPGAADWLTRKVFGKGDLPRGVEHFYRLIRLCNVFLVLVLPWGCWSLAVVVRCNQRLNDDARAADPAATAPDVFRSWIRLEGASVAIIATVLVVRVMAGLTNQTRNVFHLKWSHLDDAAYQRATHWSATHSRVSSNQYGGAGGQQQQAGGTAMSGEDSPLALPPTETRSGGYAAVDDS